ncbi:hypothetical protein Vadar_027392 [Vaccinium darrowii]|uniref:Uncharacterized protein n=1 Tax=Vaccinium darrowii TaxID=229202 RepID=A0ACB7ZFQ3_9ERIC|nr:hypothetical protein Vadar_027392 [Vaccinium darrowii]
MSPLTLRWTSSLREFCIRNFRQPLANRCMSHLSVESSENDPPFPLLGPPEIYLSFPNLKFSLLTQKGKGNSHCDSESTCLDQRPEGISDPFMDMMVSNYNNTVKYPDAPKPYMGFTENHSPTFISSGNPCLDFFFHVVADTPSDEVTNRLQLAWDQNPLTALKLVCHLRGIRGTGKGEREGFYAAALWLHQNHPKTLADNATSVVEFGYFKDLLEILYRLLEGPDVRKQERIEIKHRKMLKGSEWYLGRLKRNTEENRIYSGKKSIERYYSDPVYRFLHNKVSQVFADALKTDLDNMNAGDLYNISWAAKWCPSLYSFFDRSTLVCESIARKLFPREVYPEYDGIEDSHYAYRIRYRLQKEVLVPLRKVLKLPEVYMSANEWSELPYSRVTSVAMKNYKEVFLKHDESRFKEYLGDVKKGKVKIAAGALLPHEIIASLSKGDGGEVAELQWNRIVDDLKEIGKLKNCLAICDVSGSMYGTPLEVSVALGLLVSELSEEPWKNKLITFSSNPQLQMIEGDSLQSKVFSVKRMNWQMSTNFQKVFDTILEVAKKGNLSEDKMIKRLFVFSDMEFDEASENPWETDYEAICRKFDESGYKAVPEIVFWNLRNSNATPVPSHQKGVALVSGFSKNLLKVFLEKSGDLNPEITMERAIAGEEYNKLVVVD